MSAALDSAAGSITTEDTKDGWTLDLALPRGQSCGLCNRSSWPNRGGGACSIIVPSTVDGYATFSTLTCKVSTSVILLAARQVSGCPSYIRWLIRCCLQLLLGGDQLCWYGMVRLAFIVLLWNRVGRRMLRLPFVVCHATFELLRSHSLSVSVSHILAGILCLTVC